MLFIFIITAVRDADPLCSAGNDGETASRYSTQTVRNRCAGWVDAQQRGRGADGVGPGRFTGYPKVEILDEVFLPSARVVVFPELEPFYLVQDNSPIHTSSVLKG